MGSYPIARLGAAILALAIFPGCADRAEAPPPAPPTPGLPDSADILQELGPDLATMPGDRARYAAATIEISCLGAREVDPQRVARYTREIYARHGFSRPMRYLDLVSELEADAQVQATVAKGEHRCNR